MARAPTRSGRPRKASETRAARERLLDAAHALMCERQTIDVPVQEIAARADLNVALINYYFDGKDGLLLALAMRHQADYAAALDRLLRAPLNAAAMLEAHIRGLVRAFRRTPYLQRLQHKILRDSSEEEAKVCGAALVAPLAAFYVALAANGVRDGSLLPVAPINLYASVVGAADFLFSGTASLRHGFGVDAVNDDLGAAYEDHLVRLVLGGLSTP